MTSCGKLRFTRITGQLTQAARRATLYSLPLYSSRAEILLLLDGGEAEVDVLASSRLMAMDGDSIFARLKCFLGSGGHGAGIVIHRVPIELGG